MKYFTLTASILALGAIAACSADTGQASTSTPTATPTPVSSAAAAENVTSVEPIELGADISQLAAGTYEAEETHAYITFQYLHQGYSRPTLRWNSFTADVVVDPENPENSTLSATIDAASIDSGVEKFDQHLVSADFFDVANHPTITFNSTAINQSVTGKGKLVGDLTMKGITKPVTLDVVANRVDKSRSGDPMFGISAKTQILRSDWDLGKYTPFVGDAVDISVEIEFIKAK